MSRKYIASLAGAAVLLLLIGALIRNRLQHAETRAAAPSEASALQQLSLEGQLRRMSSFLTERANAVAPFVEYVDATGAAGVRWGNGDTLISTRATRPVVPVVVGSRDTARASPLYASDSAARDWVVVVGRRQGGRLITMPAMAGGRTTIRCGDIVFEEHVLGAPLHAEFAGAGVFDLTGRVVGVVVRCPTRLAAITARDVSGALADPVVAVAQLWESYGIAVTTLDGAARSHFGSDSGALVTRIHRPSAALEAGLRPGDIITEVRGRPITTADDVLRIAAGAPLDTVTISRGERGISLVLRLMPNGATPDTTRRRLGLALASEPDVTEGVVITTVQPNAAADAAGLRAGDRLLWLDDVAVRNATTALRFLDSRRNDRVFVVFERDSVQYGILLPR